MRLLGCLFLVVFLASCASQSTVNTQSNFVQNGMAASQVQEILGPPQNRQFSGRNEAWQYCATDFVGFSGDQFVLVWLFDGRVTGLERYTNTLFGTCEAFFRQISFEDAPDTTIEIRAR